MHQYKAINQHLHYFSILHIPTMWEGRMFSFIPTACLSIEFYEPKSNTVVFFSPTFLQHYLFDWLTLQ